MGSQGQSKTLSHALFRDGGLYEPFVARMMERLSYEPAAADRRRERLKELFVSQLGPVFGPLNDEDRAKFFERIFEAGLSLQTLHLAEPNVETGKLRRAIELLESKISIEEEIRIWRI